MTNRDAYRLINRAESSYVGRNVTRWYSTVHPKKGGEAVVKTWAVKTWKGKPLVMLASEYRTDGGSNKVSGRCLVNNTMHTRHFNWVDYGGRSHLSVWSSIDEMKDWYGEAEDHIHGRGIEFFGLGRFLNTFDGTKYKYCAFGQSGMRISDYIDLCRQSSKTELLTKSGLRRWLTPRWIERLSNDKGLMRFVARNSSELKNLPPSSVDNVYRRYGESATAGQCIAYDGLRRYGLASLPLPRDRVVRWLNSSGVDPEDLRSHVANLRELGMDLSYEPHVLPHDWHTYSLEIERRVEDARAYRAKQKELALYEARREARETIAKWVAEGRFKGCYKVVIPYRKAEYDRESRLMHNCVRTYYGSERTLVFIRKNGRPYIDMEVNDDRIVQRRYNHNADVDKPEDIEVTNLVASAFRRTA